MTTHGASDLPGLASRGKQLRRELLARRQVRLVALRLGPLTAKVLPEQDAVGRASSHDHSEIARPQDYVFGG